MLEAFAFKRKLECTCAQANMEMLNMSSNKNLGE
jgi:hypothetical protein